MNFFITSELLKQLAESVDFNCLKSNKLPATFHYMNKNYIPVRSHSLAEKGFLHVAAHEVIPLENYKSNVKPLFENEHFCEVLNNKREVGYHARLLNKGNQQYVMINPIVYFHPIQQPKQLEIF